MKITTEKITPTQASIMLEHNSNNNRKMSESTIRKYAKDMLENRWLETGESIKFSKQGILIDGQQRLSAVVMSNKAITFVVVRDLEENSMLAIDTGKSRNAGDVFTIQGITNSKNVAACMKIFNSLEENNGSFINRNASVTRSSSQLLYNRFQQMSNDVITEINNSYKPYEGFSKILPVSFIAALRLYIIKYSKHPDLLSDFTREFFFGLTDKRTILTFRKRLTDDKLSSTKKMITNAKYDLIIQAWNLYVTGNNDRTQAKFNGNFSEII